MATRKHGARSSEKGAEYERKIVKKLHEAGFVSAKRNLSQSRTAKAEGPDIVGVHGVWFELCHAKNADPRKKHAQAVSDAEGFDAWSASPVVVWRRNGFLKDQVTLSVGSLRALCPSASATLVTADLDDFLWMLRTERGL